MQDDAGRVVGFTVVADSFLWNQIRRMASALHKFVKKDIRLDDITLALDNPNEPFDLGLAPANGLILWSLGHPEFSHKFENLEIIEGISMPPEGKKPSQAMVELGKNGK